MRYIDNKFKLAGKYLLGFKVCLFSTIWVFGSVMTPLEASAGTQTVYWGGVGFSGTWQDRKSRYPATSELLDCKQNEKCLDTLAREKFAKKKFNNFSLSLEKIDRKEIDALVGVLSINNEFYGTYQDWKTKDYALIARIFGQFLVYEIGTGKIIHNVPFAIRANHISTTPLTEKEKIKLFQKVMISDELGINFFDEAYNKTKQLDPTNIPGKYTKIGKFEFSKAALKSFVTTDDKLFGSKFGSFFESELVGRTDAQFVPMSIGDSEAGNKIKMTFGDGERTLTIPEATFNVSVLVRKAQLIEKTRGKQRTICPAVAITLNVSDAMDTITNLKFAIFKDACGVTSIDQKLNMRYRYSRSLFSLLQNMAMQFGMPEPSAEWLERNAAGNKGKDVKKEIKNLNKTVFSLMF
jgi:hypothetical protein